MPLQLHPRVALSSLLATLLLTFSACDSPEGFLGGSILAMGLLGIVALALILYACYELITSSADLTTKIIWGVVIWFIPFIGAILYLLIGRK